MNLSPMQREILAIMDGPMRTKRIVKALHKDRGFAESDIRQALRDLVDSGYLGITIDWKLKKRLPAKIHDATTRILDEAEKKGLL